MLAPYLAQAEGGEQLLCSFRFKVNGTSDPDFLFPSNMAHVVQDVTYAATGVFTVTFAVGHRWPGLVSGNGKVMSNATGAALGQTVEFGVDDYVASTGVLTVRVFSDADGDGTYAGSVPTDNDWICLDLVFQRRTLFCSEVAI